MTDYTIRFAKWFGTSTPVNAVKACLVLDGASETLTIKAPLVGTEGNDYSVEVVVAKGNSKALSAAYVGSKLTIALGTDGSGDPDDAKNTFALISAAVNAAGSLVVTASGVDLLDAAVTEDALAGGQYATKTGCATLINIAGVHYTSEGGVDMYSTNGWKSATPA